MKLTAIISLKRFAARAARLFLMAGVCFLSSCIRVEYGECPPLKVHVVVKDKNYYNVNKVDLEDAVPENLPFRNYVPNLTYQLRNIATGEVVADEPLFDVPDGIGTYDITFDSALPFGTYELTVWGGISDDEPLSADRQSLELHPGGIAGGDPYLTRDTLLYSYDQPEYTVGMKRIKGKLIVETWFLPRVAVASINRIDHLRTHVNADFVYSGETTLTRNGDWSADEDYKVWKTILPPSTGDKESVLDIDFYDAAGKLRSELLPKDVNITMNSNALTVLRYVWTWNEDTQRELALHMLTNDNWEVVHHMLVE